jgi:hydrogenase maturation protein HypF
MTLQLTVFGVVQGVGYRPFVAEHARSRGLTGTVKNSGGLVVILVSGEDRAVSDFSCFLRENGPEGAAVLQIREEILPDLPFDSFRIIESSAAAANDFGSPVFPPDLPMCETCEKELSDPNNRRYCYPFISCASCGPRYSILKALPYDRENTAMADFPMCGPCAEEYGEGRRRHAQTISCHDCGPQLLLRTPDGESYEKEEAFRRAAELLKCGSALALKGVGGYQLACLPTDPEAVRRLRMLKGREKKPFAVMFPSLESVREVCVVSPQEEKLLTSSARPIVLLSEASLPYCAEVSGESRSLGAFLPCTGLHQMLTKECGPLVMTSANATSEPILYRDGDALDWCSPDLAGVLYHTREIVAPQDDSVARVACGSVQILRRSRGYVPLPVRMKDPAPHSVLAMGGDLKSSFCLFSGQNAYVSQYFGDLESSRAFRNYRDGMERMERIFGIDPDLVACDLHPGYLSSRCAREAAKGRLIEIQHHHAHAASVMAEHGLESCIGVVFDGTGFGTDGTVWGGEFLLCRGAEFNRKGHLSRISLCGGDAAAVNASLLADCYRHALGLKSGGENFPLISAALEQRINTAESSSMGRLFDAVSAMLRIREKNTYEGECAIALENAAQEQKMRGGAAYPLFFRIVSEENGTLLLDQSDLISQILRASEQGASAGSIALGFHEAICDASAEVCRIIRTETGENRVALSGGVFANLLLLEGCADRLKADGFEVFLNSAVPSNDGGLCLGQAWICSRKEFET